METKTFYIIDDRDERLYVARFTRTEEQVKPQIWALKPGECLPIDNHRAYTTE